MKQRQQTKLEKRRRMYLGVFHDFPLPSGKPTSRDLISMDSLEWDTSGSRRRRRTEINRVKILAKLWDEKQKELRQGEKTINTVSVRKMIQTYLDSLGVTEESVKQYTACLNHFVAALGDFDLENPPRVEDDPEKKTIGEKFKDYLKRRGLADDSINSNIRQVQSFFIWCDERKVTKDKIKLEKLKLTKKVPLKFSELQMDQLLELIEKHIKDAGENKQKLVSALNQRRAFYMFRFTGARAGELRSLPLTRISLLTATLQRPDGKHQFLIADVPELGFKVKGKHEAFIPIAKNELLEFLEEDLAGRSPGEKWFLDNGRGKPQWNSVQTFGRVFDSNMRKLGIKGKRTHGFRATVISNLLNKGTPAVAVKMLARHSNLSTTLGYHNPDDDELRKHIEANL